jgi:hypothetical protein
MWCRGNRFKTLYIIYGYIIFNDFHGYGRVKYLTSYLEVYAGDYYYRLKVAYQNISLVNQASP